MTTPCCSDHGKRISCSHRRVKLRSLMIRGVEENCSPVFANSAKPINVKIPDVILGSSSVKILSPGPQDRCYTLYKMVVVLFGCPLIGRTGVRPPARESDTGGGRTMSTVREIGLPNLASRPFHLTVGCDMAAPPGVLYLALSSSRPCMSTRVNRTTAVSCIWSGTASSN